MNNTRSAILSNAPLFLAILLISIIVVWPNIEARLAESRTYRDLAGLTPFSQVEVTAAVAIDRGAAVSGVMRKDRCSFSHGAQVAYVTFSDKPRKRTIVDMTPEDETTGIVGQSRPPSGDLESWGPWVIVWRGPTPAGWQIFVDHEDCPSPPFDQTNLFAAGEWPKGDAE